MPLPLVVIGVDVLEPAEGCQDIGFTISVHIGNTDSVAILGLIANVVHLRLRPGEVYPKNARVVVVSEDDIGLAIAVDVRGGATFGVVAVGDQMRLPHTSGMPG